MKQLMSGQIMLRSDVDCVLRSTGSAEKCLVICPIILDYLWEKLNTGCWADVDDKWRHVFYVISYVLAACQGCSTEADMRRRAIRTCDMGILLGVRPNLWQPDLTSLATILHRCSLAAVGNSEGSATDAG